MNKYTLLGVNSDADAMAIKKGYFAKVKIHTPDKDPQGFKAIREAYETLKDTKKRAKYDQLFAHAGIEDEEIIATGQALLDKSNYKEASEYLEKQVANIPHNQALAILLVQAYIGLGKLGKAQAACKAALLKHPQSYDIYTLRGVIAYERKHYKKSDEYFQQAVSIEPKNPKAWKYLFMLNADSHPHSQRYFFSKAVEANPDMFKDEYTLYLLHVNAHGEALDHKALVQYVTLFAKYFIPDQHYTKNTYETILQTLSDVFFEKDLLPITTAIVKKINASHYRDAQWESLHQEIAIYVAYKTLNNDNTVHHSIQNITISTLSRNQSQVQDAKFFITNNIKMLRPAIKRFKQHYPEYFALNQDFFEKVLNNNVKDKVAPQAYRSTSAAKAPIEKQEIKIGRNAPCPCGSGKKYKQCCLK